MAEEAVNTFWKVAANASEEAVLRAKAEALGLSFQTNLIRSLELKSVPPNMPIGFFKRSCLVPLSLKDGVLTVAINNPANYHAADELCRNMGAGSVDLVVATEAEISSAIHVLFDQTAQDAERVVEDLQTYQMDDEEVGRLDDLEDLMDVTSEAPIIKFVNMILTQALKHRASDIHLEPYGNEVKIRFRVDGLLFQMYSFPKKFHTFIVSRIKVMANLDIAEKRLPQDGRIKIKVGNTGVDIRVSIIPMTFGERIVLRVLDKSVSLLGLEDMGMELDILKYFEKLINRSSGIILVTGPTGSGKTTTLYASISRINSQEKNIITIEDPVEYELKGVGQIHLNPKTELTFARGLRSILRHDPDIIMVGEIRDRETAEIAIQASLTGHLVLSTLHTNDAAGALTRLVDMGIEPFLIASSLLGVLAQRLIRKICPNCKEQYLPGEAEVRELGLPTGTFLWRGRGCQNCIQSGYKGRTGLFELLRMDNEVRTLLTSGADSIRIKETAMKNGMCTLFSDGVKKACRGITTVSEVMRVTQE
jgi:general secretion pathway protein E